MIKIWGTPELQPHDDYTAIEDFPEYAYHGVTHLFSALLLDTDKFYCPINSYIMHKYPFKGFIAPPCVSDTGMSLGIGLYGFYKKSDFKFRSSFYEDKDNSLPEILRRNEYTHFIKQVSKYDSKQAVKDLIEAPLVWFNGALKLDQERG